MEHFIGMVKTKELPVPLEEMLEIMKICLAAEKSSETGEEVMI